MKRIWIAASAVIALSSSLLADTVTSSTGTFSAFSSGFTSSTPAWTSYSTPPATTGSPFWNNASGDTGVGGSHNMNAGYLLTDSGGFTGTPSVIGSDTVSQELTASSGTDPIAFNFLSNATAYNIAVLFAESSLDTGNAAQGTVFGYYVGNTFTALYTPVNTNSPTNFAAFDPTTAGTSYGFYATVCYGANLCETYTTGEGNFGNVGGAAAWNHFALFELASGSYVIGFEDTNNFGGEGMGDFNDIVVELRTPATAPEPDTLATMGIGLVLILVGGSRYFGRKETRA